MPLNPPTSRGGMGLSGRRSAPSGSLLGPGPPGATGAATTLNRLSVAMVFVPAGTTVTAVWWSQTAAGAGGALIRPVIYSCHPTFMYPAALLLDVGTQAADGANADKTVAITPLSFADDTVVFTGAASQSAVATMRPTFGAQGSSIGFLPMYTWFQSLNAATGQGFRHDAVSGTPPATFNAPSYSVAGTVVTGAQTWVGLQVQ